MHSNMKYWDTLPPPQATSLDKKKRHLIYQAPRLVALNHDCGLQAMCLTSLSLSFLACKMRITELP